ncbi:MAG: glycosyltransferase [Rhodanobacteraceae bacterium]
MESMPLITIALCTYNGERYLAEQIASLQAQTGVRIEIVAIDDASEDATPAMLRSIAERDPRVRVFANPRNLGPTPSFERAMELGTGEFIAPCDQDDVWASDKLAKLLAAIGTHDLAYCDSAFIDAHGKPTDRKVSDRMAMMSGRRPMPFVFRNSVSGHASLVRRSLFDLTRPFPADVYHDWWLALCAASRNGVIYLDEALVEFRRHDDAFSRLGRGDTKKLTGRSRLWLTQRHRLLTAFARSDLAGHENAARLLSVYNEALVGKSRLPLLREIWRQRDALSERGHASLDAIRLQLRFLRKLRGAGGETASIADTDS